MNQSKSINDKNLYYPLLYTTCYTVANLVLGNRESVESTLIMLVIKERPGTIASRRRASGLDAIRKDPPVFVAGMPRIQK